MIPTKALVTGATGLVGSALLRELPDVVITSRDAARAARELPAARAVAWQSDREPLPRDALSGVTTVFNLAGESIADGRWTDARKRRIRDSRVDGTRRLVEGIAACDPSARPSVLVSASGIGFYGDAGDRELDETAAAGDSFLADVCVAWEREALAAEALGVRVVCVRIAMVLARDGGALAKLLPPFKLGVGGPLGSGAHWMAWIHVADLVGLLLHASANASVRGPMNAVAPGVVTNADFTRALGHAVHRPAFIPVPKFALRVAFGELGGMLFESQRAKPAVAERTGYVFRYPELGGALADVVTG